MKDEEPLAFVQRWNRIFRENGRSIIVALDHIPLGLMEGWEYPQATLEAIVDANPDAILANFGILKKFSSLLKNRVGTILRLDGSPTYLVEDWKKCSRWEQFFSVEDAVNIGADAVITNLLVGSKVEIESVKIATRVSADCLRYQMPCAFSAIPIESQFLLDPNNPKIVSFAARLGAELGADFVNVYCQGDKEIFKRISSRCPVPVLMAGGPKAPTDEYMLSQVKEMLEGGGRGIIVGRNIWQHQNPKAILKALERLIHQDASVDDALQELLST